MKNQPQINNPIGPARDPRSNKSRQNRADGSMPRERRALDRAIGEIMVLISQRATHAVLLQKVEALYRWIRPLLPDSASANSSWRDEKE